MIDLLAAAKMRDAANLDIVIPATVHISSFARKFNIVIPRENSISSFPRERESIGF